MKGDTYHMTLLFDFYGELRTDKQKELFDLYYNDDLSLTEISETVGISRQGARDAIVRAEATLLDTEKKVGLVKKYAAVAEKIGKIGDCAHYLSQMNSGKNKDFKMAEKISEILKLVGELK